MCCCSTFQDVFNWVGAVIVNIAFMLMVSYSASESAIAGFFVCLLYTIALFEIAKYFEQKPEEASADEEIRSKEVPSANALLAAPAANASPKTVVGLFYGLGILAIGATGSLFAFAIIDQVDDCGGNYYDCDSNRIRKYAITNIFVTILPMILVSLTLWRKKSIPTCGFTTYFGIALFGIALITAINPNGNSLTFINWWLAITSLAWVLALSYLYLLPSNGLSNAPLSWGINTGALAFFSNMFSVVKIEEDTILNWILINMLCFIPLFLLGVVTEHNFMVFLGACGFLIDAGRVSNIFDDVIVQFMILALSGLGVMAMGVWQKNNQDKIRDPLVRLIPGNNDSAVTPYGSVEGQSLAIIHPNDSSALKSGSVFCCANSEDVFSWVGALIVNIAFISIISVSASGSFVAGFFVCLLYTIVLFGTAKYFDRKPDDIPPSGELHAEKGNETAANVSPNGLGILAIGATGSFLALTILGVAGCGGDYYGCDSSWIRKYAITNIFLTILPMIFVSLALWRKKSIPTCGFTTYFGIALFGIALIATIDPNGESTYIYNLWLAITSLAWVLALSYLYLIPSNGLSKAPLSWGINTGALVFFGNMFSVVKIEEDTVLNWILINLLCFIPLILQGVVTEHNFMVFLGAFGLLIDAGRVSATVGDVIVVQFIILALAGLGVTAMGMWLKKNQDKIRDPLVKRIVGQSSPSSDNEDASNLVESRDGGEQGSGYATMT